MGACVIIVDTSITSRIKRANMHSEVLAWLLPKVLSTSFAECVVRQALPRCAASTKRVSTRGLHMLAYQSAVPARRVVMMLVWQKRSCDASTYVHAATPLSSAISVDGAINQGARINHDPEITIKPVTSLLKSFTMGPSSQRYR